MKRINRSELIDILAKTDSDLITLDYIKEVKMNKKGNPFFRKEGRSHVQLNKVTKEVMCLYGFGKNYADEVTKALAKQGETVDSSYQSKETGWYETIVKDKVVRHRDKGNIYVKVFAETSVKPSYEKYFVDDVPADDSQLETIKEYEQHYAGYSKSQEEYGVEKQNRVVMFVIDIDNIKNVVIGDDSYEIDNS